MSAIKLTTKLFMIILLASCAVSQAAKLQDASCASHLETDPFYALVQLAYKSRSLTLADLKQLALNERPADPFISLVDNPGNIAIATALRRLISNPQTLNNWASTQRKLIDFIRAEHGEMQRQEDRRNQTRQILSPQLIKSFYTAGDRLAWTAIEGGDVLVAVVTNYGRLRVQRLSDSHLMFETDFPLHNDLPWTLGWHLDAQGKLFLWLASDVVKKLDWDLKRLSDVDLPSLPQTWTAETWISVPRNHMLLEVLSRGHAEYVDMTDPQHAVFPATYLSSLFVLNSGKVALAYPNRRRLLFHFLGEDAPITLKIRSSLIARPQIFETEGGRILVAALQRNRANHGMFLDVFEPLKSTQAIFHRDLRGISFDPKMAWFTNKLAQPLLGLDIETDYTSLAIFEPLSESGDVSQPIQGNLKGWIQSGDQVYFWTNKDENKIKIYKVFANGAK